MTSAARFCERTDAVTPVHPGRFFQLHRDGLEIAHEQPGAERHIEPQVRDGEPVQAIRETERAHHGEHRDEEQRGGREVREHQTSREQRAAGEVEAAQWRTLPARR